jgi:hypothetical protein
LGQAGTEIFLQAQLDCQHQTDPVQQFTQSAQRYQPSGSAQRTGPMIAGKRMVQGPGKIVMYSATALVAEA